MALLNLDEDPWLKEFESCQKLQTEIMEQLTIRQGLSRQSGKYSLLSANIRLRLKQYNNEVGQLKEKLHIIINSGTITSDESERRSRQIEILSSKDLQMNKLFSDQITAKFIEDREQLLDNNVWGRPSSSTTDISNYTVDELRNEQKKMLNKQDEGLENLSQIIARQKNIAENISNEVDYHNEIIEDLGTHIESTDNRLRNETTHITVVDTKDNVCAYWVVIILLFICIIFVGSI